MANTTLLCWSCYLHGRCWHGLHELVHDLIESLLISIDELHWDRPAKVRHGCFHGATDNITHCRYIQYGRKYMVGAFNPKRSSMDIVDLYQYLSAGAESPGLALRLEQHTSNQKPCSYPQGTSLTRI
jgi:hypothetical protein